ncbi:hypothetical protein [Phenylobacterium aquaticum]|uniref:hypothetical protein n=1 Tax=Phenylobacterium aquaticum TaxID=1763816 RepID=UPI001F5DD7AE|nr:hypothetical protein [Phenylobacterium aquaticum]MCI3131783.1 hypothetical protein [Phenylobacterium aquaticum]
MSITPKLITAALAGLVLAGPAAAQMRPEAPAVTYREGLPAVNAPAPSASPDAGNYAASSAFARWYQAAGRPSILLFWNRELLEDATSQYDSVQTGAVVGASRSDAVSASSASTVGIAGYGVAAGQGDRVAASSRSTGVAVLTEQRQRQERSTESRYALADPTYAHGVESAIFSTFLSAGAKMVSREALMRKISTQKSREDRLDIQYLETLAMGQGVQYLMEVLPDNDPASPTGVSFTVRVTHLPTSTVKAQFVTSGDPPRGQAQWTAVNGAGFEKRAATSRQTPQLVGAQIAYDTMVKLR